jgi:HEAT repeat protein
VARELIENDIMNGESQIESLIFQCRHGSAEERCAAIADLEEIGARESIPILMELSDFPDAGVRANVAHALGQLGNGNVGAVLLTLLADIDSLVRIEAAESLGRLRYIMGLDALATTLRHDRDPLVRLHAAEALGRLEDLRALPSLVTALDDPEESVRAYAADSIGRLGAVRVSRVLSSKLAFEKSAFVKAHLLVACHRLGDHDSLRPLVQLSETADDVLAVTVLNLAVDLATAENALDLKNLIKPVAQSRPALSLEVDSLIKRLDSIK